MGRKISSRQKIYYVRYFFYSLPVFKFRDVKINPDLKGQPIKKAGF
jgi:hypothetical protein